MLTFYTNVDALMSMLYIYLQLAKRGLNVVLMSRSEEKLSKVAAEISKLHHGNDLSNLQLSCCCGPMESIFCTKMAPLYVATL